MLMRKGLRLKAGCARTTDGERCLGDAMPLLWILRVMRDVYLTTTAVFVDMYIYTRRSIYIYSYSTRKIVAGVDECAIFTLTFSTIGRAKKRRGMWPRIFLDENIPNASTFVLCVLPICSFGELVSEIRRVFTNSLCGAILCTAVNDEFMTFAGLAILPMAVCVKSIEPRFY